MLWTKWPALQKETAETVYIRVHRNCVESLREREGDTGREGGMGGADIIKLRHKTWVC